jgi:hypothetical protein
MKKCPKMLLDEEADEARTDTASSASEASECDWNFETQIARDFQTYDEPL